VAALVAKVHGIGYGAAMIVVSAGRAPLCDFFNHNHTSCSAGIASASLSGIPIRKNIFCISLT